MQKDILLISEEVQDFSYFINAFERISGSFKYYYAQFATEGLKLLNHYRTAIVFVVLKKNRERSGLLFLSAVKAYKKFSKINIYFFADNISDEYSDLAKLLGAAGCIEKKADLNVFTHELKAVVQPELLPHYVLFPKREIYNLATLLPASEKSHGILPRELERWLANRIGNNGK